MVFKEVHIHYDNHYRKFRFDILYFLLELLNQAFISFLCGVFDLKDK